VSRDKTKPLPVAVYERTHSDRLIYSVPRCDGDADYLRQLRARIDVTVGPAEHPDASLRERLEALAKQWETSASRAGVRAECSLLCLCADQLRALLNDRPGAKEGT
jgi:hypothetical protein